MTANDGFDRLLSAWLEEEAAMRAPDDLLPQVMDRAAHTRRRPGWATTGRWISMETRAQLGAVPRSVIVLATLAVLTVLAAGAGLIVRAGGSGTSDLAPTGPAANGLIAFNAEGDIWVVNPDGSDPRRLTSGSAADHSASWSRDGTRLAYWSVDPAGSPATLIVMNADGTDPRAIFIDEQGRTPIRSDWSPDGKTLAFALCPERPCTDLFVVASDGSATMPVGDPTIRAEILTWSPDGQTLAFGGTWGDEDLGVYLIGADGSDIRRITRFTSSEPPHFCCPSWSPDGGGLVTHASIDGIDTDIWVIPADGEGDGLNLTEGPATGFLPSWSPDGEWVAFRDGETIFLVPASGGEVTTLGNAEDFTWSPDGEALALGGLGDLRIVEVPTGRVLKELPDVPAIDSWQRLAP
jgi:Tol biopolymer transport system component